MKNLYYLGVMALVSGLLMGCGSTAGGGNEAQSPVQNGSAAADSSSSDVKEKSIDIKPECRAKVVEAVSNADGSYDVLLDDKSLYAIDTLGTPKLLRTLTDDPKNYTILSEDNVIIHWHPDRIMLEHVETGTELFKMDGDPASRKIWFSNDSAEIALKRADGKYNVWSTKKGFGGISTGETVQDFINRQSPDHQLGYPGNLTAMAMGTNGHVAVAINYPADYPKDPQSAGKSGLIYHLDSVNAPGKLSVMSRTNTTVKTLAISNDASYIAAVDESGQLYFLNTSQKSFIVFAQAYKNVRKVRFSGSDPILITTENVIVLNHNNGAQIAKIDAVYDDCRVNGSTLYCYANGYLDFYGISTGTLDKRIAIKGDQYAIIQNGEISGTMPDSCH